MINPDGPLSRDCIQLHDGLGIVGLCEASVQLCRKGKTWVGVVSGKERSSHIQPTTFPVIVRGRLRLAILLRGVFFKFFAFLPGTMMVSPRHHSKVYGVATYNKGIILCRWFAPLFCW
jgi:hypothetical protein